MKRIVQRSSLVAILLIAGHLYGNDFQQRFGPDSAIYNAPLYFASRTPQNKDHRPRRSFREQIRTRMKSTKKSPMQTKHGAKN